MRAKNFFLICAILALCSCSEIDVKGIIVPTETSSNERFKESIAYNQTIARSSDFGFDIGGPIEVFAVDGPHYSLYFGTDLHVRDSINNVKALVNKACNDEHAVAILLGGDLIQGQSQSSWDNLLRGLEYDKQQIGLNSSEKAILTTVGNHDLWFAQWPRYKTYFHTTSWYAEVKCKNGKGIVTDYIVAIDTASGTLGEEQLQWLRSLLASISQRKSVLNEESRIVVMSHTNIINDADGVSSLPIKESMELLGMFEKFGVNLVLMGHNHYRAVTQFGSTTYAMVETLKEEDVSDSLKPGFCKVNVDSRNITLEFISAESCRAAKD